MTDAERLEEITEAHHECRDDHKGPYVPHCAECGGSWPCGTVLLVAEVERLRGVAAAALKARRAADAERLEEITEAHHECRDDHKGPYVPHCAECGGSWPCGTVLLVAEVDRLRGVAEVALAQVGTICRRPTNITDTRGRVGHPCGEPAKCLPCALAELEGKG